MQMPLPDDWEPLLLEVDGKPAGFAVNLNAATPERIQARPHLFYLTVPLHSPNSEGLTTEEENDDLNGFMSALLNPLAREHDAQFVGRVTTDGARTFYFYVGNPDGLDDSLDQLLSDYRQYEWKFKVEEEPTWETYWEFLHPSPEELQVIMNTRALRQMQEHGDNLEKPRRVDHWAYFPDEETLAQFKASELMAHFEIDNEELTESGWRLQFFRNESVQPIDLHRSTIELLRAAHAVGGSYDGWEAEGLDD